MQKLKPYIKAENGYNLEEALANKNRSYDKGYSSKAGNTRHEGGDPYSKKGYEENSLLDYIDYIIKLEEKKIRLDEWDKERAKAKEYENPQKNVNLRIPKGASLLDMMAGIDAGNAMSSRGEGSIGDRPMQQTKDKDSLGGRYEELREKGYDDKQASEAIRIEKEVGRNNGWAIPAGTKTAGVAKIEVLAQKEEAKAIAQKIYEEGQGEIVSGIDETQTSRGRGKAIQTKDDALALGEKAYQHGEDYARNLTQGNKGNVGGEEIGERIVPRREAEFPVPQRTELPVEEQIKQEIAAKIPVDKQSGKSQEEIDLDSGIIPRRVPEFNRATQNEIPVSKKIETQNENKKQHIEKVNTIAPTKKTISENVVNKEIDKVEGVKEAGVTRFLNSDELQRNKITKAFENGRMSNKQLDNALEALKKHGNTEFVRAHKYKYIKMDDEDKKEYKNILEYIKNKK